MVDVENELRDAKDPFNLNRFVEAQERDFARALSEIRGGRKRSHWMWFIFPQFDGLGFSATTRLYSIKSLSEARAYLNHPVLGPRLVECAKAALGVEGRTAQEVFGSPDDMKLRSCATLFASISPPGSPFHRLLEKFLRDRPIQEPSNCCGGGPEAHEPRRPVQSRHITFGAPRTP